MRECKPTGGKIQQNGVTYVEVIMTLWLPKHHVRILETKQAITLKDLLERPDGDYFIAEASIARAILSQPRPAPPPADPNPHAKDRFPRQWELADDPIPKDDSDYRNEYRVTYRLIETYIFNTKDPAARTDLQERMTQHHESYRSGMHAADWKAQLKYLRMRFPEVRYDF